MADLESMTPSERATFTAAQRLFGSPETRLEAQRLLKKVDPTRHIPELDQHEQMEARREENRKLERRMEERVLREEKAREVGERQQALMLEEQARQAEAQRQRINQRAARVFTTGEADHTPPLAIVDPNLAEIVPAEVGHP
jgi:regulator of protease activity HflC (stomatin/prohibitin superfamily)